MKKINYLLILPFFLVVNLVWADAGSELRERLDKISSFSADYNQRVSSANGAEVQQGSGKFQIKRPNLFRMDNISPQETQIIADGKTLWFYDPFVEQVTANWVTDAVNNTPFILLTTNNPEHWEQYSVSQNNDDFVLKPKSVNSNIMQFNILINNAGVLRGFSVIEKDGQSNLYILRNISEQTLADDRFKFTLPNGVELDDQRKK